ncbi:MAG: adenylyl-sulfate kinase [Alphaproteobacteria bacterium]
MIFFFIGLQGAGKTTIGRSFYEQLKINRLNTVFIDGDMMRNLFSKDLGYSLEDRKVNLSRILSFCSFCDKEKLNVVCSVLCIFPEYLEEYRKNFTSSKIIYINVEKEEILNRDQKALFSNPNALNVVGKDIDFLPPVSIDLEVFNPQPFKNASDIANEVLIKLENDGISIH